MKHRILSTEKADYYVVSMDEALESTDAVLHDALDRVRDFYSEAHGLPTAMDYIVIPSARYWMKRPRGHYGDLFTHVSLLFKTVAGSVTDAVVFAIKEDFFNKEQMFFLLINSCDDFAESDGPSKHVYDAFEPVFSALGVSLVRGLYTNPMINKPADAPTFRDWIKKYAKHNLIPHFYGKKSKAVCWNVAPYSSRHTLSVANQIVHLHGLGWERHLGVHTDNEPVSFCLLSEAMALPPDRSWLVYGYDVERRMPVCGMNLTQRVSSTGRSLVSTYTMVRSVDDRYRPYSLGISCHAAIVRHFYYERSSEVTPTIELCVNIDGSGDYKESFCDEFYRPYVLSSIAGSKCYVAKQLFREVWREA